MGLLRIIDGKYENRNAVRFVIQYITRTRPREERGGELIAAGSVGTSETAERMVEDFLKIQKFLRPTGGIGKKINHEVLLLTLEEAYQMGYPASVEYLYRAAQECALYYYMRGFQVVFAIHRDIEKGVHFHFAVNTVNYRDGRKWSSSVNELRERENLFLEIIKIYSLKAKGCYRPGNIISPICFYDKNYNHRFGNTHYYVSVGGMLEGIFDDEQECILQTRDSPEAKYCGFVTLESAITYMENEVHWGKKYIIYLADISWLYYDYNLFMDALEKQVKYIKSHNWIG